MVKPKVEDADFVGDLPAGVIIELKDELKKANKINQKQNTIMIILTIVLVALTIMMVYKAIFP